jgi:uncharacterized ferritin-like protein (DUF455 family)
MADLVAFCRQILERGDLAAKLEPPPADGLAASPAPPTGVPVRPVRDPELALSSGAARLPRARALGDPRARAVCLARFAHHELMAVELFAWALLQWPALSAGLREGWLRVLADEQRHCRLYLARLAAHGGTLADHPRSDYFWRHVGAIAESPHGPAAFLAVMGLTLEQANLDFAGLYAEGFRAGGDPESAAVCELVHADEVRHVRLAAVWLRRLAPAAPDDLNAYLTAVPFPFGPHRAKGRRFDADARRRAGLSESFIEVVRAARSHAGGG